MEKLVPGRVDWKKVKRGTKVCVYSRSFRSSSILMNISN